MKNSFLTISTCIILLLFPVNKSRGQENALLLKQQAYFHSEIFSVLPFLSGYPSGKQGGLELIIYEDRIATNGNILVIEKTTNTGEEDLHRLPIPQVEAPEKLFNYDNNSLSLRFTHDKINLDYIIELKGVKESLQVNIITKKADTARVDQMWFDLELYPQAYTGKSFHTKDEESGIISPRFTGTIQSDNHPVPLAKSQTLTMAPEEPLKTIRLHSENSQLILSDDRGRGERNWLLVRMPVSTNVNDTTRLTITPKVLSDWKKTQVIGYSQAGYHPHQPKKAVIETSLNDHRKNKAKLLKMTKDGTLKTVLAGDPKEYGQFLRYHYKTFDFSEITEQGVYKLVYGDQETGPFQISNEIFKEGLWQPSVQTFLPVQMCHMRVEDRGRLWHAACHLDDALQAPVPLPFFDGFHQSDSTWTTYQPETSIPGLNRGGWHDAADDDINTGSTGHTTYHLALIAEEFSPDIDQTTIDREKLETFLHQSDGKNDIQQQIVHGLYWLLAQYRVLDQSLVGVISSSWDTYLLTGAWGMMTDHLFYDPKLPLDSVTATHSGRKDDRYAFTNKDSGREFFMAAVFAASHRAIRDFEPDLAVECLQRATQIWEREINAEPVIYNSVGTPTNLKAEKLNAAVELFLTTNDEKYLNYILEDQQNILENIDETAWLLSRVIDEIDAPDFLKSYQTSLNDYAASMTQKISENPYGIRFHTQVWGIGWNLLWHMQKHYYLIKKYPDIFPPKQLFNVLDFILGCHPGSNHSFVSGIGTHEPIPAFGLNRSDFSFINGGVFSGTNLSLPDFPELKSDHPFLWQQSEYIVFGATPFVFCVLAADELISD